MSTPRAARKGPRSPSIVKPEETNSPTNPFHAEPFRQSKPGRAPRKILEAKDDVDDSSVPASPLPALLVCSPSRKSETVKCEPANSTKHSALTGGWLKSEHEGLLTLHDGTKRWYHCEFCDYRNDRLYHSKMHFQRIHVKNGKSMPRKRKYVDEKPGAGGTMALPNAPVPRRIINVAPAEVPGLLKTPVKVGRKTGMTPPRFSGSPVRSPKTSPKTGNTKQRLFVEPQHRTPTGGKARRVGSNLKVFENRRSNAADSEDALWSATGKAHTVLTFRDGSIDSSIGSEQAGGAGVSIKLGVMNLPCSLPVGRSSIIGLASSSRYRKPPKKSRSAAFKHENENEITVLQQENDDAGQADPFEMPASSSSARRDGSPGKGIATPRGTPVCSPARPLILRDGLTMHTPLQDPNQGLRLLSPRFSPRYAARAKTLDTHTHTHTHKQRERERGREGKRKIEREKERERERRYATT